MAAVAEREIVRGAYFSDGTRLLRVVDAAKGDVAFENCLYPDALPPEWVSVNELRQLIDGGKWRRVVPEDSRS